MSGKANTEHPKISTVRSSVLIWLEENCAENTGGYSCTHCRTLIQWSPHLVDVSAVEVLGYACYQDKIEDQISIPVPQCINCGGPFDS